METNLLGNCKTHDDLPILFICTDGKCNNNILNSNKHLCELCLNLHDKSHKFIISTSSIFDETYDKMLNSNIEKGLKIKENIEKLQKIFQEQIHKEFKTFTDKLLILVEKSKADLLNQIEAQKNKAFEEIEIWKDLKIKLDKISTQNMKTFRSELNLNIVHSNMNNNFDTSIEIDDSKFIQELNFYGSGDKRNNFNNSNIIDMNLSCLSKDDNLNPGLISNANNNLIPASSGLSGNNQINNNPLSQNTNNNINFYFDNKMKIISIILEKHIEQFVNNTVNYDNISSQAGNNNETNNMNANYNNINSNNLKFSANTKNILKNFCMDFNFKLKSLLETNFPLSSFLGASAQNEVYANIRNFNSNKNVEVLNINPNEEVIDKNVVAYGVKKVSNNDREAFNFDANGGEYSPRNSMILNFNKNNMNFNVDTVKSVVTNRNLYANAKEERLFSAKNLNIMQDYEMNNFNSNNNFANFNANSSRKNFSCNKNNNYPINPYQYSNSKEREDYLINTNNNYIYSEINLNPHKISNNNSSTKLKANVPLNRVTTNIKDDIFLKDERFLRNTTNDFKRPVILANINSGRLADEFNENKNKNHNQNNFSSNNTGKELERGYRSGSTNFWRPDTNNIRYVVPSQLDKAMKTGLDATTSIQQINVKSNNDMKNKHFNDKNVLISNFNQKTFELTEEKSILIDKKGSWFSLDYIPSLNFIVCGFENGEIVIFEESNYKIIRTYRPRFKRIRKILYSEENSSIFGCYDDGFIITINILDFKFETYKKSDNQIYTFDIMKNYNIIVWGGYDRKINFSPISNMDTTQLFWESLHGEIQCIFHDLETDVLATSFRKNKVAFFNFKKCELLKQFSIEENEDACGMIIKKYDFDNSYKKDYDKNSVGNIKKSTILISGFFMSIHQFEISENPESGTKIEFIRYISAPYTHIYDILFINQKSFLISTFEEGKILLLDFEQNKIIKVFHHFYNSVLQISFIKNKFYLTSHGDHLKTVNYEM